MDGFEKFIKDHRNEFDEYKADREKMWKHIHEGLVDSKSESKLYTLWKKRWFQVAASIVLLVGFALAFLSIQSSKQLIYSDVTELVEIDLYYEKLVAKQVKLVKDSEELSEDEKAEFLDFMTELDQEYEHLKMELASGLDNEKVLEAIVQHYQKRIEIIQSLLNRINQSKNKQNEKGILL